MKTKDEILAAIRDAFTGDHDTTGAEKLAVEEVVGAIVDIRDSLAVIATKLRGA